MKKQIIEISGSVLSKVHSDYIRKNIFHWIISELLYKYNQDWKALVVIEKWTSTILMSIDCDDYWFPINWFKITTMDISKPELSPKDWNNWDVIVDIHKTDIFLVEPIWFTLNTLTGVKEICVWRWSLQWEKWQNINNLDINQMQKIVTNAMDKQDPITIKKANDISDEINNLNS